MDHDYAPNHDGFCSGCGRRWPFCMGRTNNLWCDEKTVKVLRAAEGRENLKERRYQALRAFTEPPWTFYARWHELDAALTRASDEDRGHNAIAEMLELRRMYDLSA